MMNKIWLDIAWHVAALYIFLLVVMPQVVFDSNPIANFALILALSIFIKTGEVLLKL